MDAVEFLKEWKRMCDDEDFCKECKAYGICGLLSGVRVDTERIVYVVENWAKTHPDINLSEDQKTAIRGRIAEGWKWITVGTGTSNIYFTEQKPCRNSSGNILVCGEKSETLGFFFDFVNHKNSPIYLPDLLGGEE